MPANNFTLTTDFNTSPYYDDYDATKDYHRIIFKPSLAVQARELTQLQTILQKQIDRFGENIFKEGSLVLGGQFNVDFDHTFIKIKDTDSLANPITVSDLNGKILTGANNGVTATVVGFETGTEGAAPDTKMLYIKYTNSGTAFTSKLFTSTETVTANGSITFDILSGNTAIGTASSFSINDGVLFAKDHFIRFDSQEIILDKFSSTPNCKVGFLITESIVDSDTDATLLDPAQGSYNFAAPGADRLKLTATLTKVSLANTSANFIELLRVNAGVIEEKIDRPQYSIIRDELARRTNDESGSYIVQGMNVRVREHLNDGANFGLFTSGNGGNSSLLAIGVEPGIAYVRGYDVETLITKYVNVEKGLDYKVAEQQTVSANYGHYVLAKELSGVWDVNEGITVSLYNAASTSITSKTFSATTPGGSVIGTAKLKAIEHHSGTIGTAACQYRLYLYDIRMTSAAFSAVRTVYFNHASLADAIADVVLESGSAVVKEQNFDTGVYNIAAQNIRKIRDASDLVDTTYQFTKRFDVTINGSGAFSIATGATDEIFPFSTGALNSTQKQENFTVTVNASANVALTGTASVSSGNSTVTGSGTAFTTELSAGDKLNFNGTGVFYTISSITNDTTLILETNATGTISSEAIKKRYVAGDILNFASSLRTITVASSTSANFALNETLTNSISASVVLNLSKTDAQEIKKTLAPDRYVLINCATNSATNVGPWNLGISDVFRIQSIRKHTSSFSTVNDGTDVTTNFELDDGQRDELYDHASFRKKATSSLSIGASDYMLIKLTHFSHDTSQGVGYFSIDSYPIDDVNGAANTNAITTKEIPFYTSPTTGDLYNLRDSIDIRPIRLNTAASSTTLGGATTDPASTTSMTVPTGGLHTPAPNENFVFDLSYYLKRKDLISVNKNGELRAVKGVPSLSPITPEEPADNMSIAVVDIAPYPSLPPDLATIADREEYGCKIKNVGNKRFTMRDIGVLEQRIQNLEYYTTLSLLEKETLDLKIVDSAGLDRFKNGIIVDPFVSHKVGDIYNPDYTIAIDPTKNELRPRFEIDQFSLKYISNSGLTKTGALLTLPYTHSSYASQLYATSTRNASGLYYKYIGELILDPDADIWTDTTKVPDLQINEDNNTDSWIALADSWGTQWNSWSTNWTGVSTQITSSAIVTTTTTSQVRTGNRLIVTPQTITNNYGTRVIDVSLIPFIRSRTLQFTGYGLKPSTKLYAFFDGEDVTSYITPANSSFANTATEGGSLVSDSSGNVYGFFRIPSDDVLKFRVGSKPFRLTDSITNSSTIGNVTTSAEATYTSQGLSQTTQDTIVSTRQPSFSSTTVSESRTLTSVAVAARVTTTPRQDRGNEGGNGGDRGADPIAQTFIINVADDIPGIFATKVDLYFATKDANHGVTIEIREVESAGYITSKIVPFSKVIVPSASINTSSTGATATTITFSAPVFLLNNTEYALVIKPIANNPNTVLWTAKLGETDLVSGARVNEQPYSGILFASSNDRTYTPIQDEDLKFNLYRAVFTTGTNGTATIHNSDYEFFLANTVSTAFTTAQETVRGEHKLTLSSIVGTFSVGHQIEGDTSGTKGTITDVAGSVYRLKDVPRGTNFTVSESLTGRYANNTATGATATLSSVSVPDGKLDYYYINTASETKLHLSNTTGTFAAGEQLRGQTSNATAIIASVADRASNLLDLEVFTVIFDKTFIDWTAKTTSSANVIDTSFSSVSNNENNEFDSERKIASKSNEAANLSGNKSLQLQAVLRTTSEYVSPIIDTERMNVISVKNIINNDTTGETNDSGGNALARYITQKVTLAEGQDAEDLKVFLTAYRPDSTDIKVYYKILHGEDSDLFTDVNWVEMTLNSKSLFSDKQNKEDYKEFEYTIPTAQLTGSSGEVQYTNSASVTFTGFKYYAIKIVLLSTSTALIPKVKDMRGIALQI